jgi:hypothetical protein
MDSTTQEAAQESVAVEGEAPAAAEPAPQPAAEPQAAEPAPEPAAEAHHAEAHKPVILGYPPHERALEMAEDAVEAAVEELNIARSEVERLTAEYDEAREAALKAGAKLHEEGPVPPMEEDVAPVEAEVASEGGEAAPAEAAPVQGGEAPAEAVSVEGETTPAEMGGEAAPGEGEAMPAEMGGEAAPGEGEAMPAEMGGEAAPDAVSEEMAAAEAPQDAEMAAAEQEMAEPVEQLAEGAL